MKIFYGYIVLSGWLAFMLFSMMVPYNMANMQSAKNESCSMLQPAKTESPASSCCSSQKKEEKETASKKDCPTKEDCNQTECSLNCCHIQMASLSNDTENAFQFNLSQLLFNELGDPLLPAPYLGRKYPPPNPA